MGEQLRALVISSHEDLSHEIRKALEWAGIASEVARTCSHARIMLEQPNGPDLVLSEVNLPDGTVSGVVGMAAMKATPAPVIVISQVLDYQTFMDAIEAGAADFISPPFSAADVAWIISNAIEENRRSAVHAA